MSGVVIRRVKLDPFLLIGRWEKDRGFVLTEYERYGDDFQEVSVLTYHNEKALRKAFSNKLSKLKKMKG